MAEQAIRVDISSGAPLAIRSVLDTGECRWLEAASGFRVALERSPDDPVVNEAAALNLWASIGHIDDAVRIVSAAARRAPASAGLALSCAYITMLAGDAVMAAAQLESAALLGVDADRAMVRILRTELALATGDADVASVHIAALLATVPSLAGEADEAAAISVALTSRTPSQAARTIMKRLIETKAWDDRSERTQILLGQLISWQVRLDALESAFALAERLVEGRERTGVIITRAIHPWWREDMHPFRSDDRFNLLAERLDLPRAWSHLGEPDRR